MRRIEGLAGCMVVGAICLLPALAKAQTSEGANDPATAELRTLMTTALSAARTGDYAKLKEIARGLVIPDYELWFKAMFGEEQGARFATAYGANLDQTEKWYPKLFEWLTQQEGELVIEDVKTLPQGNASWCGQTLANMQKGDMVLYRVSVGKTDSSGLRSGRVAGYFSLVGAGYRRLHCHSLRFTPASSGPHPMPDPLRVGANVQAPIIIKRLAPVYPEEPRTPHLPRSLPRLLLLPTHR